MLLVRETRGWMLRRLAIKTIICALLLVGACNDQYSLAKQIRREIIYPAITVVVGLVVLVVAVSDVEAVDDSGTGFDCAVTNRADQAFELWDGGQPVGVIGPGETRCFTLGTGEHDLYWRPLEYGAEYYDLAVTVIVPAGNCYLPITLAEEKGPSLSQPITGLQIRK